MKLPSNFEKRTLFAAREGVFGNDIVNEDSNRFASRLKGIMKRELTDVINLHFQDDMLEYLSNYIWNPECRVSLI